MTHKPRSLPRRKPYPQPSTLKLALLWVAVSLAVSTLLEFVPHFFGRGEKARYEAAAEFVLEMERSSPDGVDGFGKPTRYGITQTDYSAWRQTQKRSAQPLSQLTLEEAKEIYRSRWQTANCQEYQPPLDTACLDSALQFGSRGNSFFGVLPNDPTEATIAVAQRREAYRQRVSEDRQLRPFLDEWLSRDRALAAFAEGEATEAQWWQIGRSITEWIPNTPASPTPPAKLSSAEIQRTLSPVTVQVWITTEDGKAPATGILLNSSGLVLTNYHVVQSDSVVPVRLRDGREFKGVVTDRLDSDHDLALVQIQNAKDLPAAPLAESSSSLKLGDTVYAIGSPNGEGWKVTTAEVIELNSVCTSPPSDLRCIRTPKGFLNPGNSGGPLIDSSGKIIGINRAIQIRSGEGVSIPIETIRQFLQAQGIR